MNRRSDPRPGDVICVRTYGRAASWIRFGAALLGRPNTVNHVIVVTHLTAGGRLRGVQAQPGGVGWVDIDKVLRAPYTLTNAAQPKTDMQRADIAEAATGMLGTAYDWEGITLDGLQAIHAPEMWKADKFGTSTPDHVVCSSLADWVYEHVGLAHPGGPDRTVTPGDWADFIIRRGWETP